MVYNLFSKNTCLFGCNWRFSSCIGSKERGKKKKQPEVLRYQMFLYIGSGGGGHTEGQGHPLENGSSFGLIGRR